MRGRWSVRAALLPASDGREVRFEASRALQWISETTIDVQAPGEFALQLPPAVAPALFSRQR
jgi:hypothetical protein